MIKSVWVENQNGNRLDIGLVESGEELGFVVFNLEGLGSPVATVNGTGGPGFDGIMVNSVVVDSRHLMLTLAIGVNGPDEEEARALIYEYFPIKQEIIFGVVTDTSSVCIGAFIESSEFNQFAKVENVVLSMVCPKPYFMDTSQHEMTVNAESGIPLFEFPFSNEDLYNPLLVFGLVTIIPTGSILYTTGVAVGMDLSLIFEGFVDGLEIGNSNGGQVMTFDFSGPEAFFGDPVEAGDQLIINTRVGEKGAEFIRDGVRYNMLNGVGIFDDWIELRPGKNLIAITATDGEALIETDIRFNPLREGI